MNIKKSVPERIFDTANVIFMILLMIVCLYPFVYVFFASLSDPFQITVHRGLLFAPKGLSVAGYKMVFNDPMVGSGYLNTLIYLIVGTSVNLLLTSIGAYALSRKKLMLRDIIMFGIAFTMLFRGGLIPLYLQVYNLNLLDKRLALILPSAISAWNLIIMRTSFQGIPDSIEESARIDGANDWIILFRIILPLSLPVVAVMVLFYGVYHWNSWFHALIFIRSRELYPLQLVLREILIENETSGMSSGSMDSMDAETIGITVKYAVIIVATLPILTVYPLLQKYFMKGVMIGAIKG